MQGENKHDDRDVEFNGDVKGDNIGDDNEEVESDDGDNGDENANDDGDKVDVSVQGPL